jgi:hypothetical protein
VNLKQVTEIAFNTLTRREKYRILAAFILQASLSALELFGVLLFSILANLIVTQNIYVQNRYLNVLFFKTLSFDELTTTKQIAFLGTLVIAIFVFRTVFTALCKNYLFF